MIESPHAQNHHLFLTSRTAVKEAECAMEKHGAYNSFHEAYAVLLEEVDELWDEIKTKEADFDKIYIEAIQVAGIALRMAVAAHRSRK